MEQEMLFDTKEHEMEATLTERQAAYLEAYRKGGSSSKAAVIMGVTRDTASSQLSTIAKKLGFTDIRDVVQTRVTKDKASGRELLKLIQEQDYKCALSGVDLTPSTANLDHKIPRKNGGSDSIVNLQWLSYEVNRMKGSMDQDEFIRLCGLIYEKSKTPV
jgi:DNA-binding CsgD family transcriptional regulator